VLSFESGIPAGEASLPGEIVSGLREGLREKLVAVVLFGSRARGEAHEGSDWDFLIVAHCLPEGTLERGIRLKQMLPPAHRGEVSLLAKTPEEFTGSLPDIYLDIALDGVILYDVDGYVAEKLSSLSELARRKGLRRERQGTTATRREGVRPGNYSARTMPAGL
jgi:predicted nucleotidyltransferase